MTDFLPPTYEKPASNSRYYKFQAGENRFRILSPAITGWIDWRDEGDKRVPVRTKQKEEAITKGKLPKHFWSFVIWDYQEKNIKVMEITQATIQDAIYALHSSEDWGSPTGYDVCINKTGEKMETRYQLIPKPPKELDEEIKGLYAEETIDLEKLFDNGDPFEKETQEPSAEHKAQEKAEMEIGKDIQIEDIPM